MQRMLSMQQMKSLSYDVETLEDIIKSVKCCRYIQFYSFTLFQLLTTYALRISIHIYYETLTKQCTKIKYMFIPSTTYSKHNDQNTASIATLIIIAAKEIQMLAAVWCVDLKIQIATTCQTLTVR